MTEAPRCSALSEQAGEPLGATATHAVHWLLVEVSGTWPRDVSDAGGLPGRAHEAVRAWLERTPASRVHFLRRPGRRRGSRLLAFVVDASEDDARIRRVELSALDELGDLDLERAGDVVADRLVLVCGHGTRDACCALHGNAVYAALTSRLGVDELWISSHQGGHRFAANVLVLPGGIQLGRLRPDSAPYTVARALADRIELPLYRGRVAYTQAVQAAERAVREAEGLEGLADLRLVEVDGERISFRSRDGRDHVAVVEEVVGPTVPASCGAEPEVQTVLTARLV